jgi:hypothetical protein
MKAAVLTVLTLRVAFWLERVSRRLVAVIPQAPAAKFDLVAARRDLSLERAVYAARTAQDGYEFLAQDEYFRRVERLLERSVKS